MDTSETRKRPWWRKTRMCAAVAVWIVVAYPLTVGPLYGLLYRGLYPSWAWNPMRLYIRPYSALCGLARNPAADAMQWYARAWLPERRSAPMPDVSMPYRGSTGELPRITPDPRAPGSPVDPANVPPLPSP